MLPTPTTTPTPLPSATPRLTPAPPPTTTPEPRLSRSEAQSALVNYLLNAILEIRTEKERQEIGETIGRFLPTTSYEGEGKWVLTGQGMKPNPDGSFDWAEGRWELQESGLVIKPINSEAATLLERLESLKEASLTPIPTPTSTPTPTWPAWKGKPTTWTHPLFGYSIRLPSGSHTGPPPDYKPIPGWEIYERSGKLGVKPPPSSGATVNLSANMGSGPDTQIVSLTVRRGAGKGCLTDLKSWSDSIINAQVDSSRGYEKLVGRKHLTVAGLNAYEATFTGDNMSGMSSVTIYLLAGQNTYTLYASTWRIADGSSGTTQFEFLESILYSFDPGPDAKKWPCP